MGNNSPILEITSPNIIHMEMTKDSVAWFEIPVSDFERAKKFYSAIFDYQMPEWPMGPDYKMGVLLYDQEAGGIGGAIIKGEGYVPGTSGPKVYLAAGKDLTVVLNRVEKAGGKIVFPKTQISPELGYFARFIDSEGNELSLHSMG
jgi:predicted enzyme related to lactoylglutathione lyase